MIGLDNTELSQRGISVSYQDQTVSITRKLTAVSWERLDSELLNLQCLSDFVKILDNGTSVRGLEHSSATAYSSQLGWHCTLWQY